MGKIISKPKPPGKSRKDSVILVVKNPHPVVGHRPPPPPPCPSYTMVRALYPYTAQNFDDISFNKNDLMYVLDKRSSPWWMAQHATTQAKGYIPCNYVVEDNGLPTSLEAWFDIKHAEADRRLLMMGNPPGTYIVRPCAKNIDGLCCRLTKPCPREYIPPPFPFLEISRQSVELIREIGHGSFGQVFLGRLGKSLDVAVKVPRPNSTLDRKELIDEAERMHGLYHEKVVQIYAICTQPTREPVYIVMEFMEKGSLLTYLQKNGRSELKLDNLIDIMGQICMGMAYLESKKYIHRDLRAANILVGRNLIVKVADFGLARVTQSQEDMETVYSTNDSAKFPVKWTAPEAAATFTFSIKSDVWSFGVLMYEIVTFGGAPYPNMRPREVLEALVMGYRMPCPSGDGVLITKDLYDVMRSCWTTKPDDRPTFATLQDMFENWTIHNEQQYPDIST